MSADPDLAMVAQLIGEPARAAMLAAVLRVEALPAGELARAAGVSPQTASMHLAKLVHGGLMQVRQHGRHRYYALSGPQVAEVLEQLALLARPAPVRSLNQSEAAQALRFARTCYDHLAGTLGVAVAERLLTLQLIAQQDEEYAVTQEGIAWLAKYDLAWPPTTRSRCKPIRRCLDWSERRYHIAGAFGALLTAWLLDQGWIERHGSQRAVQVTALGRAGLLREWGLDVAVLQTTRAHTANHGALKSFRAL